VAAVLPAIVDTLVGLTLTLRPGDATTPVALVAALVTSVLFALRNSLVAPVRDMSLLLLRAIVVVSAGHRGFSCQIHLSAVTMNACGVSLVHSQANYSG
jgi:hypothetical protein